MRDTTRLAHRLTQTILFFASLILFPQPAFAGCESDLCEFNCREDCRVKVPFGNYVDNVCFNACLSREHVCKAALPAKRALCRSSLDYQETLAATREARSRGLFSTHSECRAINSWATRWAEKSGGSIGREVFDNCGCFICETVTANPTPQQTSSGSSSGGVWGVCTGRGGLTDLKIWGPSNEVCHGLAAWGTFVANSEGANDRICSCTGKNKEVQGVRFWGPEGEACMGNASWGTYSQQCVRRETADFCGCIGRGNILGGHTLWGPKGNRCGGMEASEWGTYSQRCTSSK